MRRLIPSLLAALAALVGTILVTVPARGAATEPAPTPAATPVLAPTFASVEEMMAAVMEALNASDIDRLRQLAVTPTEFHDLVWPEIDASRPERRLTWDFVWSQHEMRHERGLKRAIALFGGQDLVFDSINFPGGVRDYPSFRLHRSSIVRLITPEGTTSDVEIFASVIEVGGRFKIYSFITD